MRNAVTVNSASNVRPSAQPITRREIVLYSGKGTPRIGMLIANTKSRRTRRTTRASKPGVGSRVRDRYRYL
jgi:hypothetical protein